MSVRRFLVPLATKNQRPWTHHDPGDTSRPRCIRRIQETNMSHYCSDSRDSACTGTVHAQLPVGVYELDPNNTFHKSYKIPKIDSYMIKSEKFSTILLIRWNLPYLVEASKRRSYVRACQPACVRERPTISRPICVGLLLLFASQIMRLGVGLSVSFCTSNHAWWRVIYAYTIRMKPNI